MISSKEGTVIKNYYYGAEGSVKSLVDKYIRNLLQEYDGVVEPFIFKNGGLTGRFITVTIKGNEKLKEIDFSLEDTTNRVNRSIYFTNYEDLALYLKDKQ